MIEKENFIKVMDALDELWNDKLEAMNALGISESYFMAFSDEIAEAIDRDVDPKHLARTDELTCDCGSYVIEYLIGEGEFQEVCPTAEALYEYIVNKYIESVKS